MAISQFVAGALLTAAQLNQLVGLYAVKGSTQTVTNSAALVSDSDITFSLAANQTYHIAAHIVAQNTTTTGHLRLAWAVTGTVAAAASGQERMVLGSPDTATAAPDSMLMQSRAFVLTTNNLNTMSTANSNYYIQENLLLSGGLSGRYCDSPVCSVHGCCGSERQANGRHFRCGSNGGVTPRSTVPVSRSHAGYGDCSM